MRIERLAIDNIRVHQRYELPLDARVTVITGANGSGKTSLIEALYIALTGSSFKGADGEVLRRGGPWYRIALRCDDDTERLVKFDPSRTSGRKQFVIDGKTMYRLGQNYKYPVVLFEPDDLRLLHGSPSRRRQFLDRFISQLDPQYTLSLRRYERVLKQRNAVLKKEPTSDDLFAWDVSLSEYGSYIIQARQRAVEALDRRLTAEYRAIAHTSDTIAATYSYASAASSSRLLSELQATTRRDIALGYTSIGPHRHDLEVGFNGSPALGVASRGEVRSIVLALKFLEVERIVAVTGKNPLVLLDDVFSELDAQRQTYLLDFTQESQVIITSATSNAAMRGQRIVLL